METAELTRFQALVELSRSVRTAVSDERRLAALLADAVVTQVGGGVQVWVRPFDGGEPACLATVPEGAVPAAPGGMVSAVLHSGRPAVGSATGVPLVSPTGGVLGVLVARRAVGYYPDEIGYLGTLADTAAATLDSARLLADSAMAAEGLRRQSEWLDQVSDAIITCDAEHQVLTWNSGAELTYQYSSAEAVGCDADALLATEYRTSTGEQVPAEVVFAALARGGRWSGELRQRRADGEETELLCSLTELLDEERRPVGWVAVNRDVTDERRKERMALYDPLTGLPNRRYLLDCLDGATRREGGLAVLFVDLDGFKQVNDTLGHDAGDEVLRVAAQRLLGAVRRGDTVVRLGGDEFVVVAEGVVDREVVRALATRLAAELGQPLVIDGAPATVRGSIGVAVAECGGTDPMDLVRSADTAMYAAKRGRRGVVFADEI